MFKVIKKEHFDSLVAAEKELAELKDKSPRDLIREILKVNQLDIDFNPKDERYSDPSYIKALADLADNAVLQEEFKKDIYGSMMSISRMAPKDEVAELLLTGNINYIDVIKKRFDDARAYLEQLRINNNNDEGVTTTRIKV